VERLRLKKAIAFRASRKDEGGRNMSKIAERLTELGLVLPQPVAPVANYVPFVRAGNLLHISGQVSVDASGGIKGVVGEEVSLEAAQAAARLCGINLIAQMNVATGGDLDRVKRVVKLGGFVQAGPGFFDIPQVVNGCSNLMVEVFGDAGRHARSAVGVYRLPLNFAVEVDAVVEIA
jgi:enamine deaminase RidA (YjgF/YER057c/UK114 family)